MERSAELTQWLSARTPPEILESPQRILAGTCYALCIDHRLAIALLISKDLRSSAFALWRPVYEACIRGLWAEVCAGDAELQQIAATGELPKFESVIRSLDKQDASSAYGRTKTMLWKPMSHFAHGGILQLANWMGPEGIGARHSDLHTAQMVASVDVYALLAWAGANRLATLDALDETEFGNKIDEISAALRALPSASD